MEFIDASSIEAAEGRRRRRQRHGRPARCRGARPRPRHHPRTPDGSFPDQEPAAGGGTAASSSTRCARRPDLGHRLGRRRADRLFIDETGEFVRGDFMTALLAESILERAPGAGHPLRHARLARGGRPVERRAARRARNRVGHAFFKTRMRDEAARSAARSPATTTTSPTSTTPTPARSRAADPRAARAEGRKLSELLAPFRSRLLHLGRDQLRGRGPAGEDRPRSRSATPTARSTSSTASRSTTTTGTSTCARRTPSRCCA